MRQEDISALFYPDFTPFGGTTGISAVLGTRSLSISYSAIHLGERLPDLMFLWEGGKTLRSLTKILKAFRLLLMLMLCSGIVESTNLQILSRQL